MIWGCKNTRIRGYKNIRIQANTMIRGYKKTIIRGYKNITIWGYKNTMLRGYNTHPWPFSKSKFNIKFDRLNLVAPASPIECLRYLPNVRAIQYKLGPVRLTRLGNLNVLRLPVTRIQGIQWYTRSKKLKNKDKKYWLNVS